LTGDPGKAMTYEYDIVYSNGIKPDLTAVNNLAQEGWELFQMGQSTSQQTTGQWYYLLHRKTQPTPTAEQQPT
jgi:hypothetical protein